MSILGREMSVKAIAAAALIMIVAALLPVMTSAPEREITLVARGMAFYLEGDFDHPNPTIAVAPGERIRIVLKNDERGVAHDVVVPSAAAATRLIAWSQQDAVTFTAPAAPGAYEYFCQPHRLMMTGTLQVR